MVETHSFTAMAVESELNLLRRLHAMLETDDIASRAQFTDLMKAAFIHCHLDARLLSDDLGYSLSTVYRWIEGRSAPHTSLWPRIAVWIKDALKLKIDEHLHAEMATC